MYVDCPRCGKPHITIPKHAGEYPGKCTNSMYGGDVTVIVDREGHVKVERKGPSDDEKFTGMLVVTPLLIFGIPAAILGLTAWGEETGWWAPGALIVAIIFAVSSFVFVKGYNRLTMLLNSVRQARIDLAATLERRGIAVDDSLLIAESAADHERETHTAVASARANPFALGAITVESPPDLRAMAAYGRVQNITVEFEREVLDLWRVWGEAARKYEDARCTFPLILSAWIANAIITNRFPVVLPED